MEPGKLVALPDVICRLYVKRLRFGQLVPPYVGFPALAGGGLAYGLLFAGPGISLLALGRQGPISRGTPAAGTRCAIHLAGSGAWGWLAYWRWRVLARRGG